MMETMRKYTRDTAGFSFMELMVVIALVGVLSAIAVPNLLRTLPEKRLKNAARNLYADMQRARLTAVKENRSIRVRFDVAGGFYYFDDDSSASFTAGELRRDLTEYGNVSYGQGQATNKWDGSAIGSSFATNITFSSTGTANQGTTYLHNQNKDVCYAVTTTMYGAIKIRRFNGTTWDEK